MTRILRIVGAPTSAGAYAPGQELAPAAFRKHGLVRRLELAGLTVRDDGDVEGYRWRPDPARPKAMNLDTVNRAARGVAGKVSAVLADGHDVLVLGGDCTVELGTVAGAVVGEQSVGLIYIDLDVDLNPPEAADGALDWTGVAHLLELEGVESTLSRLGPRWPLLQPSDILFLGADNISDCEAGAIKNRGLEVINLSEVKANRGASVARAAKWAGRFERVLIHVDVDVLAFADFPIAENTRRQAGLTLDELSAILVDLVSLSNWRGLTVTEINPDHAPDEQETFGRLITMLAECLSRQSL